MAKIDQCLQKMVELGASDLHLHVDYPLTYRIDGELKPIGKPVSNKQSFFCSGDLNYRTKELLNNGREVDFAYQLNSVGRLEIIFFFKMVNLEASLD